MAITRDDFNRWLDEAGLSYDDVFTGVLNENKNLNQRLANMEGLVTQIGNWERENALTEVFRRSVHQNADPEMIGMLDQELEREIAMDVRKRHPSATKSEVKQAIDQAIQQGRMQIAQALANGGGPNPLVQVSEWINALKESRGAPSEEFIDSRLFRGGNKLPVREGDEFDDAQAELMSDISGGPKRDRYESSNEYSDPWD